MILEFIEQFTEDEILTDEDIYQLGEEWFYVEPELFLVGKDLPRKPVFVGTFLGKRKNDYLIPGVALLELLAKHKNTKKVFISDKAAWLFVCGKNVLQPSISRVEGTPEKDEMVLVMNGEDCLGIGKVESSLADAKSIVTHLFDIGDFLRRERKVRSDKPIEEKDK